MRRPVKRRFDVKPDPVYNSIRVSRLINYVMLDGKKELASRLVYRAFDVIKEKTGNPNPLEVFEAALKQAGPVTEVRSRRVGGANYQVPREVRPERRIQLALRWIVANARSGKGKDFAILLADELIAASQGEGESVRKKENTHKMAEANKAFAHFSW